MYSRTALGDAAIRDDTQSWIVVDEVTGGTNEQTLDSDLYEHFFLFCLNIRIDQLNDHNYSHSSSFDTKCDKFTTDVSQFSGQWSRRQLHAQLLASRTVAPAAIRQASECCVRMPGARSLLLSFVARLICYLQPIHMNSSTLNSSLTSGITMGWLLSLLTGAPMIRGPPWAGEKVYF